MFVYELSVYGSGSSWSHLSFLFSMLQSEDIADIVKPDGMCSLTYILDEFSGLFLHTSVFSIIHSRYV